MAVNTQMIKSYGLKAVNGGEYAICITISHCADGYALDKRVVLSVPF